MTLTDASVLIALLSQNDQNHERCVAALDILRLPPVTTLPCFTESMYLLGSRRGWLGQSALWHLVLDEDLVFHWLKQPDILRMHQLMSQYRDRPMDLADASLVAAAEARNNKRIFTLDSDFQIYQFCNSESFAIVP